MRDKNKQWTVLLNQLGYFIEILREASSRRPKIKLTHGCAKFADCHFLPISPPRRRHPLDEGPRTRGGVCEASQKPAFSTPPPWNQSSKVGLSLDLPDLRQALITSATHCRREHRECLTPPPSRLRRSRTMAARAASCPTPSQWRRCSVSQNCLWSKAPSTLQLICTAESRYVTNIIFKQILYLKKYLRNLTDLND